MSCQASVLVLGVGPDARVVVAPTWAAGGGAASALGLGALGLSAEGAARAPRRLKWPAIPLPALLIMALPVCVCIRYECGGSGQASVRSSESTSPTGWVPLRWGVGRRWAGDDAASVLA